MSFEVIDNLFQVVMLGGMSLAALAAALWRGSRKCLVLAFAYACFAMGTLYYLLYLAVIGNNPKVFYVAEISWLASYLFFLSLQIFKCDRKKIGFLVLPFVMSLIVGVSVLVFKIFGPAVIMSVLFALTAGVTVYISVYRLCVGEKGRGTDAVMTTAVFLQVALYVVSEFTRDYTRFCPYFGVDIILTLSLAALTPLTVMEERKA